jgi:molecular chaperone Hsp33
LSELHKFIFDGMPVRGILVRLTGAWTELLSRRRLLDGAQGLPQPVLRLLGELTAAGVLLQASIRFDGALVLQIFGDGPVKLAVVQVQGDLALRATAKVHGPVADDASVTQLVNRAGHGRCSVTLEPKEPGPGKQTYQGVVSLDGAPGQDGVAHIIGRYMQGSEQLDSTLVLACNDSLAAGLLVQRLPTQGAGNLAAGRAAGDAESALEDYRRIAMLAASLAPEELLAWDSATVLRRLFWQEPCRLLEPEPGAMGQPLAPRFACSCSRERVASMIRSLGQAEAQGILQERGEIEVGCEFCGQPYRYDAVDAARIFMAGQDQPPSSAEVQ